MTVTTNPPQKTKILQSMATRPVLSLLLSPPPYTLSLYIGGEGCDSEKQSRVDACLTPQPPRCATAVTGCVVVTAAGGDSGVGSDTEVGNG